VYINGLKRMCNLQLRFVFTHMFPQGYCGSCWAFSATEQIESDVMRTTLKTLILSPEQIVQCDEKSWGCFGGATESAYAYVKTAGGLTTESDYPYTSDKGVTGTCKPPAPTAFAVGLTGFTTIPGATPEATEENMAAYVQSVGPLSVCLDAATWNLYTGGIVTTCGKSVDHCVQAVGVDTTGVNPYWKVRNSWGMVWGESGYIRLAYGANTCAIATDPTYTSVVLRNV
jgi:C1A family cysteine protease